MNWDRLPFEDDSLQAAFVESADRVGAAWLRAVVPFDGTVRGPQFSTNPNDAISRWVEWWLDLPDPFDAISCELMLLASSDGPEVSGRIAVWTYLGRGFSDHDDLWSSGDLPADSPAAAVDAIRRIADELVRQCGRLDLNPFLPGWTGTPDARP